MTSHLRAVVKLLNRVLLIVIDIITLKTVILGRVIVKQINEVLGHTLPRVLKRLIAQYLDDPDDTTAGRKLAALL